MALRPVFSPSSTLSVHKSFLKGLDSQPCFPFGKPDAWSKKAPVKLQHHLVVGGLKTQESEDSTLVDVQAESRDGYVLFKFGNTQLYDDPPRFISSSVAEAQSTAYTDADREVIDCTAIVYRLPEESAIVSPFRWGYHAHEDAVAQSLKLPTTFTPPKSLGLPFNFVQSPRSGNLVNHLVNDFEQRKESITDFLQTPSSDAEMMKLLPAHMLEDVSPQFANVSMGGVQSMKSSTVRRADRVGKKARNGHKKPTRDLYRSSSFHLYELIFTYPFMDSSKAALTWKGIPKEKYTEIFDVLNQIAVGLAGSGIAIMLFVASRMLCLNATLDSTKFMSLLRGVGLLWLSSAFQKFGSVVGLMAEVSGKGRPERKEHLAMLRKEVQSVTFKLCTMVMLSMVRLA